MSKPALCPHAYLPSQNCPHCKVIVLQAKVEKLTQRLEDVTHRRDSLITAVSILKAEVEHSTRRHKMIGCNTFEFNQATVIEAMQFYLDSQLRAQVIVKSIKPSKNELHGTFIVEVEAVDQQED